MDTDADQGTSASVVVNVGDSETESNKVYSLEGISANGDVIEELRSAGEVFSQLELHIACSSEKLVNLNILTMHVATRESEFEAFAKKREHILDDDSVETALAFDLLSGLLDSELRELENFITTVEADFVKARELISSYRELGKASIEMEEKLLDSEDSLQQSRDQILEIKKQSAKFQRTLSALDREGNWISDKDTGSLEDDQFLNENAKIKLQTAEQQRHFLRMLEKSLAREMDLEKKLTESRQVEEALKFRLGSFEQELLYTEEEAMDACERLFEAENSAEVLKGISKELLGRLQIVLFNMNGSVQREAGLRSKLDSLVKQVEVKESVIASLRENLSEAQARADGAEVRCKSLAEMNIELNEDLKGSRATSEKVESLERQLRESDIQLQHAVVYAEASLEKQNMLYSTVKDMENLIEDLKLKVSKADSRADSAEEKLIILSEANAGLTEEISFLRDRLECLEASLHQAEETKLATAKDIGIRTKVITNLVMQMAVERERLRQQISSLAMENKVMVVKLQQTKKDPSIVRHDSTTASFERESKEVTELSAAVSEEDKRQKNVSAGETEVASVDLKSEVGTLRRIDAGLLTSKHFFIAVLIVLISAAAYYFQKQNYPF
ncbi:WPP domain-interacting tail-anchored protein 1 [Citrus sinensis]|uniref:WPP domain-interacting tail-anchored protein 1 n=1 Tax=Citrus sinensis TaxID=2711 RepID=UPI0003D73880|nr:WPP domain-interacting tail-anchored protein 1 [Citrus sinensis]XP_006482463.1 WPP domain-interacting tail-anchored protein 1 [Citrus sinensis]KAH9676160.1 WPP domain-interacting tail-anchored protein 1 [Citrus sinensis]